MFTKTKILESVPCNKENFPMLHSFELLAPCYIADSFSHLQELILSNLKQNESLMRIESLTVGQIQATSYSLMTWSVIKFITTMLAYTVLGRFQSQ